MDYVVAIPSYQRSNIIVKKTLMTLQRGNVCKNRINIFVANESEAKEYENTVEKTYIMKWW